ncbi:MAG TPA: hypothetical protein VK666_06655, partial [Chryseolinea sp.]|nr:hypothetical protein [Chryseolinea sp.]
FFLAAVSSGNERRIATLSTRKLAHQKHARMHSKLNCFNINIDIDIDNDPSTYNHANHDFPTYDGNYSQSPAHLHDALRGA